MIPIAELLIFGILPVVAGVACACAVRWLAKQ